MSCLFLSTINDIFSSGTILVIYLFSISSTIIIYLGIKSVLEDSVWIVVIGSTLLEIRYKLFFSILEGLISQINALCTIKMFLKHRKVKTIVKPVKLCLYTSHFLKSKISWNNKLYHRKLPPVITGITWEWIEPKIMIKHKYVKGYCYMMFKFNLICFNLSRYISYLCLSKFMSLLFSIDPFKNIF